jgi:hypothetical protein
MYMFGTPPGRAGAVQLARAPGSLGVYYGNWQYWDGTTWQSNPANAAFIVPALEPDQSTAQSGGHAFGSVSELSVAYDPGLQRYLMTYLDLSRNAGAGANAPTGAIVLRDAPNLTGPWTQEKELLSAATVPALYGGYMYPQSVSGVPFGSAAGTDLYFNVSEWGPYDVYPYHAYIGTRAIPDDLLTDGSFEEQFSGLGASCPETGIVKAIYPPWASIGGALGFDSCLGNAAPGGGNNEAWINAADATSAWHDIHQSVAVQPNTSYRLTLMIDTYGVGAGFAGIRARGAPVAANGHDMCGGVSEASDSRAPIAQTTFTGTTNGYRQLSFVVNPGPRSLVDVFVGLWSLGGGQDSWARIDEVSLVPLQRVNDGSFELQSSTSVAWPYGTEGTGYKGIDQGAGIAHTGLNDGWINTTHVSEWNAITQVVTVTPGQSYTLSGWVQTSSPFGAGFFGVRDANGTILAQTSFGAEGPYTPLTVSFASGTTTVKLFAGYWTPPTGVDTWMRVDDLSIE